MGRGCAEWGGRDLWSSPREGRGPYGDVCTRGQQGSADTWLNPPCSAQAWECQAARTTGCLSDPRREKGRARQGSVWPDAHSRALRPGHPQRQLCPHPATPQAARLRRGPSEGGPGASCRCGHRHFLPGGAQLHSRAASPSPSGTALGAAGCQCRNMQPLIARDPWKIPGCVRPGISRPATRSAWEVSRRPGKEGDVGAGAARRQEWLGWHSLPPSPFGSVSPSTTQRGTRSQPRKGCQRRCGSDSLGFIPFSAERGAERGRGCPGQEQGSPEPWPGSVIRIRSPPPRSSPLLTHTLCLSPLEGKWANPFVSPSTRSQTLVRQTVSEFQVFFRVVKQNKVTLGLAVLGYETIFASADSSLVYNLSRCLLVWAEVFHHLSDENCLIRPCGRHRGGSRMTKNPPSRPAH